MLDIVVLTTLVVIIVELIVLIGFPCRCGGTFCSTHRYANEHDCTFDYREHGAEEIRKNNPQVIGEKVTKI